MAQHGSGHGHGGGGDSGIKKHGWKVVVVVVLMLAAMAAYILSMDESLVPAPTSGPAAGTTAQ